MKKKFNKKLLLLGMLITAIQCGSTWAQEAYYEEFDRTSQESLKKPEEASIVSTLQQLNRFAVQEKYITNKQTTIEWAPTLKLTLAFSSLLATGACYWSRKPVSATVSLGAITVGSFLWLIKSISRAARAKRQALKTTLKQLSGDLRAESRKANGNLRKWDGHIHDQIAYKDQSNDEKKTTYIRIIELCNTLLPHHATLKYLQIHYEIELQRISNLDEGQRQKRFKLPKDELYKSTIQQIKKEQQKAIKSIKDKLQEKLQGEEEEEEEEEEEKPFIPTT